MKRKFLPLMLAVACIQFSACDKDDDDNNEHLQQDRDFVLKAALSNTAEIGAGSMAETMGGSEVVSNFGAMMVMEHSTAQTELKGIAANAGFHAPDSLDAEHVQLAQQLQSLDGRAFDSVYIHSQVRDHDMAIDLFEDAANRNGNSQIRNYAQKYLPHIRMHFEMADSIANADYPR